MALRTGSALLRHDFTSAIARGAVDILLSLRVLAISRSICSLPLSAVSRCPLSHVVHCITLSAVSRCPLSHVVRCLTLSTVSRCPLSHVVRCLSLSTVSRCPLSHYYYYYDFIPVSTIVVHQALSQFTQLYK